MPTEGVQQGRTGSWRERSDRGRVEADNNGVPRGPCQCVAAVKRRHRSHIGPFGILYDEDAEFALHWTCIRRNVFAAGVSGCANSVEVARVLTVPTPTPVLTGAGPTWKVVNGTAPEGHAEPSR